MSVLDHPDFDAHEGVHFFYDPQTQLRAVIAVHSTRRGPAAGGTRFWSYASSADALTDALRLSKAMSFKNAMADLPLGGGKAVVLRPDGAFDRDALFQKYGQRLNRLGGSYITAEDVGMTTRDLEIIQAETPYAAGVTTGPSASGDPSPITAKGVFLGLQVAVVHRLKKDSLRGLHVAVQGLGNVGFNLCGHLHDAGACLSVADINPERVQNAVAEFGAKAVPIDEIHQCDADIFAPCALGGAITPHTLSELKVAIVGGAANNQLLTPEMGVALRQQNILYCPDYVINAGGIINIAAELSGRYELSWVNLKLEQLKETLLTVFETADSQNKATSEVADQMARERIFSPGED